MSSIFIFPRKISTDLFCSLFFSRHNQSQAAGKRITRSQSRTKVSTATDVAGAAAEVTAGDTSDAPAKAAATDAGAGAAGNAVASKFQKKLKSVFHRPTQRAHVYLPPSINPASFLPCLLCPL